MTSIRKTKKIFILFLTIVCLLSVVLPASSFTFATKTASFGSPNILEMITQVNESALQKYVQTMQDFGPRETGSDTCNAVGEYIYNELATADLSVRYDSWFTKKWSGKNIEATLPGTGSSNGIVIVCAHYDGVSISPSANDNAGGVAIVLVIAKIMSRYSFNSTVKFVLFSGEEQGLLGSKDYARKAYERGDQIIGVINLDGVGGAPSAEDGKKIKHHVNNESAWMVDISGKVALLYSDYIELEVIRLSQVKYSDHQSFVDNGFDASYLHQYAPYPYHHTTEDTIDHMNITYLAKVCRLTLGTLVSMACLDPMISDKDLKITAKGTILSNPAQFSVKIENKKYKIDTANVTINIQMKNLFTGEYVKGPYGIIYNWNFSEEIGDYWEFKAVIGVITRGLFKLEITVKGFNDDVGLYAKQQTYGMIIKSIILIMPHKSF